MNKKDILEFAINIMKENMCEDLEYENKRKERIEEIKKEFVEKREEDKKTINNIRNKYKNYFCL